MKQTDSKEMVKLLRLFLRHKPDHYKTFAHAGAQRRAYKFGFTQAQDWVKRILELTQGDGDG